MAILENHLQQTSQEIMSLQLKTINKKIMKKLQILYLLLAFSIGCSAQTNIPTNTKEILVSKNWIVDGPEIDIYKMVFTNTKMILSLNGNLIGEEEYYLTNNLNECSDGFIQSNVGSTMAGKYIITKKMCLELISISSTKLVIKSLNNNTITTAYPE